MVEHWLTALHQSTQQGKRYLNECKNLKDHLLEWYRSYITSHYIILFRRESMCILQQCFPFICENISLVFKYIVICVHISPSVIYLSVCMPAHIIQYIISLCCVQVGATSTACRALGQCGWIQCDTVAATIAWVALQTSRALILTFSFVCVNIYNINCFELIFLFQSKSRVDAASRNSIQNCYS